MMAEYYADEAQQNVPVTNSGEKDVKEHLDGSQKFAMGFSRQAYWSGLPFPSPGDLPNPGIEPRSPAL